MTTAKFLLSSVILGSATILLTFTVWGLFQKESLSPQRLEFWGRQFVTVILIAAGFKLFLESLVFLRLKEGNMSFLKKTALLMINQLRESTLARFACGIFGGIIFPLAYLCFSPKMPFWFMLVWFTSALGLLLAGELLERYLFFRAVVPLKMPGSLGHRT